jgi:hypothetical protein
MFVSRVISYLDGWEILKEKNNDIYNDISNVLSQLNVEFLSDPEIKPYGRREKSPQPITAYSLTHGMDYSLKQLGWNDYRVKPDKKGGLFLYAKNLKEGISVRLLASDRMPSFPNWLYVEVPKLHEASITTVSVLLVPEEDVSTIFDENRHVGHLFTMNRCGAQLTDLSPMKTSAPFVIIGFSTQDSLLDIQIDELEPDENIVYVDKNIIEKSIEFPPEHYQAGIGILSYFGEVLKAKHPDSNAKIRIEQCDGLVRLHIHSSNGDKEIIEKTLEEYTLVVAEKAPIESLFKDQVQIMALENKLEIAKMEVRQTQKMLTLTQTTNTERVRTLEDEVSFMRQQIGNQLSHIEGSNSVVRDVVATNDRLVLAQLEQNEKLIDDLIEKSWSSKSVAEALEHIKIKLEAGINQEDEKDVKESLLIIRENSPELIPELQELLKNTIYGVSGNTVFQWLQTICSSLI